MWLASGYRAGGLRRRGLYCQTHPTCEAVRQLGLQPRTGTLSPIEHDREACTNLMGPEPRGLSPRRCGVALLKLDQAHWTELQRAENPDVRSRPASYARSRRVLIDRYGGTGGQWVCAR
jgi:hypothetical protein